MPVQKALVIHGYGNAGVVTDHPIPSIRPDHMLVKTKAVAINPTDWKSFNSTPERAASGTGAVIGIDYAGIVEAVPEGEARKSWAVGDRVAGSVHGANASRLEEGAFAEYIVATTGLAIKLPTSLSFESASTLGAGVISCAQGLYQQLQLPLPNNPCKIPLPVLIYGGSTATGTLAIQYAKLSGCVVITTCSRHNFELVRSAGADHVFDYRSTAVVLDIQKAANNQLSHIFDCIGEAEAPEICYKAMGPSGGKYSSLQFPKPTKRKDIKVSMVLAYNAFDEPFTKFGRDFPQDTESYKFTSEFMTISEKLLADGKLKTHPIAARKGGLDGVIEGLKEIQSGKISGQKLVYSL